MRSLLVLLVLLLWSFPASLLAQTPTHHVAKTACSDAGTGAIAGTPWCTIQKAMTTAVAGNVVLVRAGIYRERVTPTVSGSAGALITLVGERGAAGERLAVIDGSDAITGWTVEPSTHGGLYRTTSVPYELGWLGVDDGTTLYHILKMVDRFVDEYNIPQLDLPSNYLVGLSYITGHMKTFYWDAWAALWTGGNPAYVRFKNGDNPTSKNMRTCPRFVATLTLSNVHHLAFKGFQIRGCHWGIRLQAGANDLTIDDNDLYTGFAQVSVEGPQRLTFTNNLVHQQRIPTGYSPGPMNVTDAESGTTPTPGTWQYRAGIASHLNWFFKTMTICEGVGFDVAGNSVNTTGSITDAVVSGNRFYDQPGVNLSFRNAINLKIHHNYIAQSSDAGLMPWRNFTGVEVYDNIFEADAINIRPQGDSPASSQPQEIYIYRNTFHQPKQPGGRLVFYCGCWGEDGEAAANHKWYWYHNSFLGGLTEAVGLQREYYKKHYYLNNVFSTTQMFAWDTGAFHPSLGLFDYNWVGGAIGTTYIVGDHPSGLLVIGAHTLRAPGQQLWDWATPTSFILPTGSAPRNAGLDVTSAAATALVERATPLPGFTAGYFTGSAPHMGAKQDVTETSIPPDATGCYPQASLSVTFVDSQYPPDPVTKAIDNNILTHWATDYGHEHPHTLTLSLGSVKNVDRLRYTPRQDLYDYGTIVGFEVHTSLDNITYTPATTGTWAVDKLAKNATFALRTAQYVKLVSLSSAAGDPWANAAEVQVCSADMSAPVEPVVLLPVQILHGVVR